MSIGVNFLYVKNDYFNDNDKILLEKIVTASKSENKNNHIELLDLSNF